MPKIHIVREAFSLDGKDYPRGTEISDAALLEKVRAAHGHHLIRQHHDAPAKAAAEPAKPEAPKA